MASPWPYNPYMASSGIVMTRAGTTEPSLDKASSFTASQMLPAPPAAAFLPPPPPARDLHGARARITLEKVKLDIESTREVLGELSELAAAVTSLQQEIELLKAERAAQDRAAREELLSVARTAFEEYARQLKADLAPILQDLLDSVRASEARASRSAMDAKSAAARVQADLDRRLEAMRNTASRDSPRAAEAPATLAAVQQFDQRLKEVAELLAEQDGRIAGLETDRSVTAAVGGEVVGEEEPLRHQQGLDKEALPAGRSAVPEPPSGPLRQPTTPHVVTNGHPGLASSSSSLEPSPPRRKVRPQQIKRPQAEIAAAGQRATPQLASPLRDSWPHLDKHETEPAARQVTLRAPAETITTSASKKRKTPMWTEQVAPRQRRLLINGSLELEMSTENGGEATRAGREAQTDVEAKQAQMKRRRTIKQDDSLESSHRQEAQFYGSFDQVAEIEQQDVVRATEHSGNVAGEGIQSESESEPDTVE